MTEFEPIAKMAATVLDTEGQVAYYDMLDFIVDKNKDNFDALIGVETSGYTYKSKAFEDKTIRDLNLISVTYKHIKFTVDLTSTIKLYAICGLSGYLIAGTLLIAFVIYINRDLSKYVIFPLESMYEKVTILSKNPMSATRDDFANKIGIASMLQNKAGGEKDEIHLIDKSISKIAYLLAVGYGEAGTNIIINSMNRKRGMDIDIPGQKVIGIYGF